MDDISIKRCLQNRKREGESIINSMFTNKFQFCKTMMLEREKFMNDTFSPFSTPFRAGGGVASV